MANICLGQTQKRDTLEFYKKIKRIAYRHKATIFLYHSIFVDPAPENYEKKPLSDEQKVKNPYTKFQDKIIRNIIIEVYDPFGYSVNDTLHKEVHSLQKIANQYHVKTQHYVIRNLLLFKKNEPLDLIKIDESERLLRSMNYINDAHIYILPLGKKNDSIDLKILVKDKWAVNVPFTIYPLAGNFSLKDRNIFGSGQAFTQYFGYTLKPATYDIKGNYLISNIRNTYISANFFYATTIPSTQAGFSFDRPFYSALAKWAGGISANKTWTYLENPNSLPDKHPVRRYNYDNWYAKSFRLAKGETRNARLAKLIIAARCAATIYEKQPPTDIDPGKIYTNSSLNIGSIGFSLNKFYKDQFIYRFGANEDVPEGIILQLVNGIATNENKGLRYYNGFEFSVGKHFNTIGYFSTSASYGILFNKAENTNATLNTGFFYFSDIIQMKKWYLRQFIYHKYVAGFNKDVTERITLNPSEMYGFNPGPVNGTSKMLLNFETVMYSPYIFVGFRFAPLFLAGFGTAGNPHETIFFKREIYQAYAFGILVRNENFLVNSFQFTLGYYPNLPGGNKNFIQLNPVASFTLKVRNFAISKPGPVAFE